MVRTLYFAEFYQLHQQITQIFCINCVVRRKQLKQNTNQQTLHSR